MKRTIDQFSYALGAMDCFNEMLRAGLKNIALGPPENSREERDAYLPYCDTLCEGYGTTYGLCNDALITDLFPESMNKGKFNIIFFKDRQYFDRYEALKQRKRDLLAQGAYHGAARLELAYDFGRLLAYPEANIQAMIDANEEKETIR